MNDIEKIEHFLAQLVQEKIEVVFDYQFLVFLQIEKTKNKKYNISIINFIDFLDDINAKDIYGGKFDYRLFENMLIFRDKSDIIKIKETNFLMLFVSKENLEKISTKIRDNFLIITEENFFEIWGLLYRSEIIHNNNIIASSINEYWHNLLKDYANIPFKWLIIQEPFLYNKKIKNQQDVDSKLENISEFLKCMKYKFCIVIVRHERAENNHMEFNSKSNELIKQNLNNCYIIKYKDNTGKHKQIHDRFIITNYFIFYSGNSFDYFNPNTNEIQFKTRLAVYSIVSNFNDIKKELNAILNLLKENKDRFEILKT